MFENFTFDFLMQRMLQRVQSFDSAIDTSEGSVIYNSLAACAWELAENYIDMDTILNMAFADTAPRDELIRIVQEYGLEPKPATKAILKGEFNIDIPLMSRFSLGALSYISIEKISTGTYKMECEIAGAEANTNLGPLTSIEFIEGLETASLTELLIPGLDEEGTEAFRERFRNYMKNPSQDGNLTQYEQWANEYPGVGRSKIFPLWNGGNTVKVAITNTDYLPAGSTLISEFQEYIDPGIEGKGNGAAPIGSKVTVTGGTQKNISVSGNVILAEGYTSTEGVYEAIKEYLASITFLKNSVSYMRLGSTILDCPSIADTNNLVINGGVVDIVLNGDEIPVLTSLNLVVTG
ncbi:baseplate J/gp47 family protein [Anaerocolumna chitinilytica]|uniref:Baseplate assembly protein n=1 Tax=Anaerocolumna chitinilytica TaxID=1727145 RepID=A0A7M3S9Y5_9FIRM|nr:baseplate J/gp47 family protein [Anaerocolumna chitinilytica]BCK01403.1 baseplate assembly protein [Anaerocolumna chitinilytica]